METVKPVSKIGNSYGIIIPSGMLKEMGLKGKNKVRLVSGGGFIQIEPAEGREDKIMKAAAKYVKKYRLDFRKLAR
ncbi:MAG: AbrB/MazE/SpoVT family DNA-binding domain-containing protein [Deltaproteobacteria bacterium]|nr:AbrB/MazE/SpoVT family DNA-binding domain-containing protein [Deltaproteobacteria bacterium]